MRAAVLLATILVPLAVAGQEKSPAEPAPETPAQCKKRLGSHRECFAMMVSFHIQICALKSRFAELKQDTDSLRDKAQCGTHAKAQVRPFYDAMLGATKKPAALAASKKAMQAFIAVMADPPATVGLRNNLETALAELELELP